MRTLRFMAFISVGLGLASPAAAHVTLETPQADAGGYYKAVFRVGHGCAGSPTTELIVQVPAGVQNARPMPKAGWQLAVEKAPLAQPYQSHGKTVTEDTSFVRWSGGNLPEAWYDEFVVFAKLPDQPGKLYWKVTQVCEQGRIEWADIPVDGKPDSRTPAAVLELTPAHDHSQHQH